MTTISKERAFQYLFYFLLFGIIIIVGFYGYIVLNYTTNAPYFDDFFWGIAFLDEYISADSVKDKASLIFQQYGQHRLANLKLFIAGHYQLFGTINFKSIAIFGNISSIIVFIILFKVLYNHHIYRYLLFPIAFLLFQFQYYHNIITSYGFPNMGVYMWAMMAFYFNTILGRRQLIIVMICAVLATFSNGNGILTIPIILFFLYIQKRYADLKIATMFLGIFLIIYFGFAHDLAPRPINLINSINYFVKFLSVAFFTGYQKITFWLTLFMVFVFLYQFIYDLYFSIKGKKPNNWQIWLLVNATILWILATAVSVTIYRGTPQAIIPNWYFNYSILFLISFSILFINLLKNRYLKISFAILLICYSIPNYSNNLTKILPTINGFQSIMKADVLNFKNHNRWALLQAQVSRPNYANFEKLTNKFVNEGIYILPEVDTKLTNKIPLSIETKANISIDTNDNYIVHFNLSSNEKLPKNSFGFIKSATEIYYFGTYKHLNTSVVGLALGQELFNNNNPSFSVNKTYFDIAIKKGNYQCGFVFYDQNDTQKWFISDQSIIIKNY